MLNRSILTALIGIGAAQFLKIPLNYLDKGKWDLSRIVGTGGMPSSHSSAVAALTTYVALKKGVPSIDFGVSTIFSLIVVYDAMGIRRQAGEIAMEVNELNVQLEKLSDEHPGIYHKKRKEKLEELLGHLPIEVAGGAVLGAAIGVVSYLKEKE
ncbi:divergent PAP2 family protein [Virgibacillus sp. C22-A2]|uniref:Divergent PAP2 family protein n=1 Tax=Virgibacillus tibetensis TaxID=3042313 RepID=A0ABU6KK86_9BACI|nr:divergent PAP2 family protein [Virgibacillus sp. C22-A2]